MELKPHERDRVREILTELRRRCSKTQSVVVGAQLVTAGGTVTTRKYGDRVFLQVNDPGGVAVALESVASYVQGISCADVPHWQAVRLIFFLTKPYANPSSRGSEHGKKKPPLKRREK